MKFHIKSNSLPRIAVKSLLIALTILILPMSLVVMATGRMSILLDWLGSESFQIWLRAVPLQYWFDTAIVLLFMTCTFFAAFLPSYFRRRDRLSVDDYGIRFDCRFQPLSSWHIIWPDIQLPITHACLIRKNERHDVLYIRVSSNTADNPVFMLDKVSAWQIVQIDSETSGETCNKTADTDTGRTAKTDKRPDVILEIERHLGPGTVKRTFFAPQALANQARKTWRSQILWTRFSGRDTNTYNLDAVAQGLCIVAFILFMLGLIANFFWVTRAYSLNLHLKPQIPGALLVAALTLWPLRRRKNAWAICLVVASLCGGTFMWALTNAAQFQASNWGQQEIRTFALQAPLPSNPSDSQNSRRAQHFPKQIWQSGGTGESNAEQVDTKQPALKLEILTALARQPYQPGDRIELPVRCGLFGNYVLNIEETGAHFKKRLDE